MTHEWKIGDWCEIRRQRFLVYRVEEQTETFWAIPKTGGQQEIFCDFNDCDVKRLDGCDSWDWQPPKPIEPPEGYRLLVEGEIVLVTDRYLHYHGYFADFEAADAASGLVIGRPYSSEKNTPIARKIEPKVRPMTRAEFLAAWRQRSFCPLISKDGIVESVQSVLAEDDCDTQLFYLGSSGWNALSDLASFRFASDDSPLTVEE